MQQFLHKIQVERFNFSNKYNEIQYKSLSLRKKNIHYASFIMKIALIGYGRMGRMIEQIALQRGHQIVSIIDVDRILIRKDSVVQMSPLSLLVRKKLFVMYVELLMHMSVW